MSLLFPRVAFAPVRCSPVVRNDFAPLFSLFDDTLNEVARSARHARRQFAPRFDVKEAKESYSLEGELPGIDQKDIAIEFTDEHTLTIKGRTGSHTESGTRPSEVETSQQTTVQDAQATETDSVKTHQPTVEDETPATNATSSTTVTPSPQSQSQSQPEPIKADSPHTWISERRVGEFTRSFRFGDRVDQDAVKASLKNGILSIVVPKAPKPESRRVEIQ